MRVAILTQWFSGQAGGLLVGLAEALAERGADVVVVTGDKEPRPSRASSLLALERREIALGFPCVRYPYFHSHDKSAVRRMLTYSTFAATSLKSIGVLRSADVVLVYGSPATAVTAAMAARRGGGPPFVFMIQDVWPDSIFATGFVERGVAHRATHKVMSGFTSRAYATASQITANSPSMRELLISRGADPTRTHVVYNWAHSGDREESVIREREPGQPLEVMYAGNVGPGQNLGSVLDALALIPRRTARLTIVGDGAALADLKGRAAEMDLDNVRFLGRVPPGEVSAIRNSADLHLVSLADTELFRVTIPSKFQSLVASGRPVLAYASGEVNSMVERSGCGFAAPSNDPQALANQIVAASKASPSVLESMGAAALRLYEGTMSEQRNADVLFEVLSLAAEAG